MVSSKRCYKDSCNVSGLYEIEYPKQVKTVNVGNFREWEEKENKLVVNSDESSNVNTNEINKIEVVSKIRVKPRKVMIFKVINVKLTLH